MDIRLSLDRAVKLWPQRTAVIDGERRLTYAEVGKRIDLLCIALETDYVDENSVIAAILPNCFEYFELYYACASLGATLAPINFRLSPREISGIFDNCHPAAVFVHSDFEDKISDIRKLHPDLKIIWLGTPAGDKDSTYDRLIDGRKPGRDFVPRVHQSEKLAHLYYTSGTTGHPKGVMLTHGNVMCHAIATIAELGLSDSDVWAHIAPMFHLADAWATFAITWVGGAHVFIHYFENKAVLDAIEQEKVTISNLIPTMLNLLINDESVRQRDYSSLRCLLSGGAPIAPETVRKIIETFHCDYVQTYGMTETSPYLTLSLLKSHLRRLPPQRQLEIKSRTGRPFLAVELRVVRDDGSEVETNDEEVGEIIVRGPTVTPGYWQQPEATAQAIRDGWLHTGDLATIDEEGYVNIVDRKKDMIKTGGENVYSTEVEYVLYEHAAVLECAVVGVPDERWGEAVKAFVVLKAGQQASSGELIEFVRERIAHYKAPQFIEFLSQLPRTGSGKISKKSLREVRSVSD
jgi:fatty-acyl-CoA synthase